MFRKRKVCQPRWHLVCPLHVRKLANNATASLESSMHVTQMSCATVHRVRAGVKLEPRGPRLVKDKAGTEVYGACRLNYRDDDATLLRPQFYRRAPQTFIANFASNESRALGFPGSVASFHSACSKPWCANMLGHRTPFPGCMKTVRVRADARLRPEAFNPERCGGRRCSPFACRPGPA